VLTLLVNNENLPTTLDVTLVTAGGTDIATCSVDLPAPASG
jgi:hypothetical protein